MPPRRRGRPPKLPQIQGRVRGLPDAEESRVVPRRGRGRPKLTVSPALRLPGGRDRPVTVANAIDVGAEIPEPGGHVRRRPARGPASRMGQREAAATDPCPADS